MFYIRAHVVAMILGLPRHLHTLQTHAYMHVCAFMHTHTAESVNILATCAQYIYAHACLLSFIYKAL